jgi:hypothetical protein
MPVEEEVGSCALPTEATQGLLDVAGAVGCCWFPKSGIPRRPQGCWNPQFVFVHESPSLQAGWTNSQCGSLHLYRASQRTTEATQGLLDVAGAGNIGFPKSGTLPRRPQGCWNPHFMFLHESPRLQAGWTNWQCGSLHLHPFSQRTTEATQGLLDVPGWTNREFGSLHLCPFGHWYNDCAVTSVTSRLVYLLPSTIGVLKSTLIVVAAVALVTHGMR